MMLSDRPGPTAPGSCSPSGRWSDPSTSTVLPVSRLPPCESEAVALFGSPLFSCALMKNRTTDKRIQPTTAIASHFRPRLTQNALPRRGASGPRLGRCLSSCCQRSPGEDRRSRSRRRER